MSNSSSTLSPRANAASDADKYALEIETKHVLRGHIRQLLEQKYFESTDENASELRRKLIRKEAYKLAKKAAALTDDLRLLAEDMEAQRPYGMRSIIANGPPLTHITTGGN